VGLKSASRPGPDPVVRGFQTHPCGVEVFALALLAVAVTMFQTHPCGVEVQGSPRRRAERGRFRRTLVGLKFSRVDSLGARDWLVSDAPLWG